MYCWRFFTKLLGQFKVERMVFSINGTGTITYPYVKKRKKKEEKKQRKKEKEKKEPLFTFPIL